MIYNQKEMIFKLEGTELEAAREFIKTQMEKDPHLPTVGERWTYQFTPTGLGTTVSIEDNLLHDVKDLTDWSCW
jgi:hypothetical protein